MDEQEKVVPENLMTLRTAEMLVSQSGFVRRSPPNNICFEEESCKAKPAVAHRNGELWRTKSG
jgi:hypothetical protein